MPASATLTIRLPSDVKVKLSRLADVKAGRLVPHEQAMDRLEATIAAAEQGKR